MSDTAAVHTQASSWPGRGVELPVIDHALTHFDWRLVPLRWDLPPRTATATRERIAAALGAARWLPVSEALAMSLPSPVRKLLSNAD
jgi:A/G-specific adenine glycosylase